MDNFSCSLDHPIFEILSNKTRLEILRMIACEQNYGSRIASILNISAPAIHRHLKFLSQEIKDDNMEDFSYIKPSYTTSESYSGHKGAEATVYEIGTKMYFSFALYPNFIQSHAFLVGAEASLNENTSNNLDDDIQGREKHKNLSSNRSIEEYSKLFNKIQEKNEKIRDLETQIMNILEEKNDLMKDIDSSIQKSSSLSFDERVSLRLMACQGPVCIPNLPELLRQDVEVTKKNLINLKLRGWFSKFEDEVQNGIKNIPEVE